MERRFKGAIITDQASYPQAFPLLAIRAGLAGGTDMWLNSGTDNWQIDGYASNPTVMTQLRQASKHILYAVSRSLAMNGISSTAKVVSVMAPWRMALMGIDVAAAVGAAAGIYVIVRGAKRRKAEAAEDEESSDSSTSE